VLRSGRETGDRLSFSNAMTRRWGYPEHNTGYDVARYCPVGNFGAYASEASKSMEYVLSVTAGGGIWAVSEV